jgi:hypothetical protein
MTTALLQSKYDQSIDTSLYTISNLADNDYCVQTSKAGWTAWKRGPAGVIKVDKSTATSAICT